MMKIKGFTGTSLLDYPKNVCSILFLGGCNFRCPFCHNAGLVTGGKEYPTIEVTDIIQKLEERKDFIDGVVVSGGEPTIHKDLPELILKIKDLGLKVKLDTNGSNPDIIETLLDNNAIDFIAMDIKTSFEKYSKAAGVNIDIKKISRSINLIKSSNIDYEFRSTIVPVLVNEEDIIKMGGFLEGANIFYLQQFNTQITFDLEYSKIEPYSISKLKHFKNILEKTIDKVEIRGV